MTDIAALLSNSAQTNADFDLGKINRSYWQGRDEFAKNDLRDAFKGGVPLGADGQPDFAAMGKVLFQKGGFGEGVAASNLGIARDQLKAGQEAAAAIGRVEMPGQPGNPIVGPSVNRNSVAADPTKRADANPQPVPQAVAQPQGPRGDQPGSIVGLVSAAGIPDELAGPVIAQVSALTKTDPNATLNPDIATRVQQVVTAAAQRMKAGQPQQPTGLNPQQDQGTFGAPPATPTRGALPTGSDPEIQKQIAIYTAILANPAYPKPVQEAAKLRLEAIQKQGELTPAQKDYSLSRRQGGTESFDEWQVNNESRKAGAVEDAKMYSKKYESLVENGTKAQMEIPQLELLQEQMNDPNFFSGTGEKYNLLYKRLKSAVGIDPEAAVPQEYLRKATAANVLSSLGALKGLGQIRVAEINMAREAAASPENSIPANKLLVEISKRTHERNAEIAEKAQAYKEKNGQLDAGFDKEITAFYKAKPLFSDAEIKDWHKIIKQAPATQTASATPQFSSPADVHAAIASGKLKKGDTFQDSTGKTRYVP